MHLLLRSKHIAPKPRIARAPELVSYKRVIKEFIKDSTSTNQEPSFPSRHFLKAPR